MESILGLGAAVQLAPLQPVDEAQKKRPGIAFLLSLLFPGAGLIYCGKRGAGIATAIFFALALILTFTLPTTSPLFGVGLRAALVLYGYAFLDSFYTARETNAGMTQYMVGNNPRIAAMLNLITTGFGYFYLGERKKGIAVFILLRVFGAAAQSATSPWRTPGMVVMEVVLAVLSLDAYRLARKQLRDAFPDVNLDPFAANEGLPALVPAAAAGFFAFNYVALVCLGLLLPDYRQLGSTGIVSAKPDSAHVYTNEKFGVSVEFPPEWVVERATEAHMFVSARRFNGGCSVQAIGEARLPIMSAGTYGGILRKNLEKNRLHFKWLSEKSAMLSGRAGKEESFMTSVRDVDIRQDYVVIPRGLSMVTLVETAGTALADECSEDFQSIRRSVRLK